MGKKEGQESYKRGKEEEEEKQKKQRSVGGAGVRVRGGEEQEYEEQQSEKTNPEGEGLQDVALDSGGQQDDGRLWTVLVPVDVDVLTLEQLQASLVRKHLKKKNKSSTPRPSAHPHEEV